MTTYEERKSRNLTYHYDDDLYKVYKQLIKVKDKGEDEPDRKSTRLNSSHSGESRMPSSA